MSHHQKLVILKEMTNFDDSHIKRYFIHNYEHFNTKLRPKLLDKMMLKGVSVGHFLICPF